MKFLIDQLDGAESFLNGLEQSTKLKFAKIFRKVQIGINSAVDFKKLPGTDGIFEFRVIDNGCYYRILAFIVHYAGDEQATIVVTNGFKKKKNKTPKPEIRKAEKIKKEY